MLLVYINAILLKFVEKDKTFRDVFSLCIVDKQIILNVVIRMDTVM